MNKQVNYAWVGFFVLSLTALLIALVFWLSSSSRHSGFNYYEIHAKTDVSGLHDNSVVKLNGVKIGSVQKIEIDYADAQTVVLTIEVASQIPVTTETMATLKNEGITGVQYVALQSRQATAPLLKSSTKGRLPVIPFEPSVLSQMSDSISDILSNVDKAAQKMTTVLTMTEGLMPDVQRLIDHLNTLGENMADVTAQIQQNPAVILRGRESAVLGPGEN